MSVVISEKIKGRKRPKEKHLRECVCVSSSFLIRKTTLTHTQAQAHNSCGIDIKKKEGAHECS